MKRVASAAAASVATQIQIVDDGTRLREADVHESVV